MRCGHCKGEHQSVEEVKHCSKGQSRPPDEAMRSEDEALAVALIERLRQQPKPQNQETQESKRSEDQSRKAQRAREKQEADEQKARREQERKEREDQRAQRERDRKEWEEQRASRDAQRDRKSVSPPSEGASQPLDGASSVTDGIIMEVPGHQLRSSPGTYIKESRRFAHETVRGNCSCGWEKQAGSKEMLIGDWSRHVNGE